MMQQGRTSLSGAARRALLRSRIGKGRLVVAPGVFEMISATIADRMGFDALYMTGYGTVASYLGLPDAGLASYADIDILLDSYPYPGGTTTAEALWMGVPTITMGGNTMISRQGVSLLTAAGLQDWIATSEANYVAKAITWANHPEQLQALRKGLRAQVTKTALFDGAQFARDFENAMREAVNS